MRARLPDLELPGGVRLRWWPLAAVLIGIAVCGVLADRAAGPDDVRATRFDAAIRRVARRHLPEGWDWRILKAMVYQESRFKPTAVSPHGAVGLCQILPETARRLGSGPQDLRDPAVNLDLGARLLRQLWDGAEGLADSPPDWERSRAAVAAYHAGPAVLRRAAGLGGLSGASWSGLALRLPEDVRRHVEAVFDDAYPRVRRVHPGAGGRGVP